MLKLFILSPPAQYCNHDVAVQFSGEAKSAMTDPDIESNGHLSFVQIASHLQRKIRKTGWDMSTFHRGITILTSFIQIFNIHKNIYTVSNRNTGTTELEKDQMEGTINTTNTTILNDFLGRHKQHYSDN
jgi:hypothetical protein